MTPALMADPTWQEVQTEAGDLVASAADGGLTVRVVGSTGIRMHCAQASAAMDAIDRRAKDIDLVVRSGDRKAFRTLLEERGWIVDRDVLVAMEGQRYAFHHPDRGLDLDVFVEKLEFCHTIELGDRWERHATTIPIEDLLLQKLQVHEATQTDVMDAAVVLATHAIGPDGSDGELIDRGYLAGMLARDWGFHRDAVANLARVRDAAGSQVRLPGEDAARVRAGADELMDAIESAKKTMAWKMRARVGERMQWWGEVNERSETY